MKLTKQRLKEIILEEISKFNEVLQDAGGVWVIEKFRGADDERYLQPNHSWGPLWDPDLPDVIGAAVFGDGREAADYLRSLLKKYPIKTHPRPTFYSDDDLEKMELPAEEPASEEEEEEERALRAQRSRPSPRRR